MASDHKLEYRVANYSYPSMKRSQHKLPDIDSMGKVIAMTIMVSRTKAALKRHNAAKANSTKPIGPTKRYPYVVAGVRLTKHEYTRLCFGRKVTKNGVTISSFGAQFDWKESLAPYIRLCLKDLKRVHAKMHPAPASGKDGD